MPYLCERLARHRLAYLAYLAYLAQPERDF